MMNNERNSFNYNRPEKWWKLRWNETENEEKSGVQISTFLAMQLGSQLSLKCKLIPNLFFTLHMWNRSFLLCQLPYLSVLSQFTLVSLAFLLLKTVFPQKDVSFKAECSTHKVVKTQRNMCLLWTWKIFSYLVYHKCQLTSLQSLLW